MVDRLPVVVGGASRRMRAASAALILLMVVVASCTAAPEGPAVGPLDQPMGGAAGFEAEAKAAMQDTPLPPDSSWTGFAAPDPDGAYQVGLGRLVVEDYAVCEWYRYWLAAAESQDEAAIALARDTLANYQEWETYRTSDESYQQLADDLLLSASLGDLEAMRSYEDVNCGP